MWRLTYDASPRGDGSMITVWEKTLEELLVPNGPDETLLTWMMRETQARGGRFQLELVRNLDACPACGLHTLYRPENWSEGGPLVCINQACDTNHPPADIREEV